MHTIPIINIEPLVARDSGAEVAETCEQIGFACRNFGFFYVTGHGISESLQQRLESLSHSFFAEPLPEKMSIRMELGGRAWRGYFPVGDELTSGKPDQKEGLYFGAELPDDHPKVRAGTVLHGRNLFPAIDSFRETILTWLSEMTQLGQTLMRGLAMSLGLDASYFDDRYTHDPLVLFRVFHYPPLGEQLDQLWSVGEHTDYGLLTILKQDSTGGLQIKTQSNWIDAPVIDNSFVCNLGDMLDRMTAGLYRSTPHRVRNASVRGRLSFPFFFDPNWDAFVKPIEHGLTATDDSSDRWDGANLHNWTGTYGDYIQSKVAKVFPDLKQTTDP